MLHIHRFTHSSQQPNNLNRAIIFVLGGNGSLELLGNLPVTTVFLCGRASSDSDNLI